LLARSGSWGSGDYPQGVNAVDRQLLERMIGAAVLVVLLILVVPAILTGPEQLPATDEVQTSGGANLRQLTIRPDDDAPTPPVVSDATSPGRTAVVPRATEPVQEKRTPEPDTGKKSGAPGTRTEPEPGPEPRSKPQSKPKSEPRPRPQAKPAPAAVAAASESAESKASPPTAAAKRESGWVVQLGSFASKPNAEGLASKVKAAGYQSYLEPLDRGGQTLYRVRVGPPDDQRSKAEKLAGRLARAGYRGQVTRQEAGG